MMPRPRNHQPWYNQVGGTKRRYPRSPRRLQRTTSYSASGQLTKYHEDTIATLNKVSDDLKTLILTLYVNPLPDPLNLPLDYLINLTQLSFRYRVLPIMAWCIQGIRRVVSSPQTVLRHANSNVFLKLLYIAIKFRDTYLFGSIVQKWVTRLHWHDIPPTDAILVADAWDLQALKKHACYAYLMESIPKEPSFVGFTGPLYCPALSRLQNTQIQCGYHSLSTRWSLLSQSAPSFEHHSDCIDWSSCTSAWEKAWKDAVEEPSPLPKVDVLNRLRAVNLSLEKGAPMDEWMTLECRRLALKVVASIREHIYENLQHYFDL